MYYIHIYIYACVCTCLCIYVCIHVYSVLFFNNTLQHVFPLFTTQSVYHTLSCNLFFVSKTTQSVYHTLGTAATNSASLPCSHIHIFPLFTFLSPPLYHEQLPHEQLPPTAPPSLVPMYTYISFYIFLFSPIYTTNSCRPRRLPLLYPLNRPK